MSELNTTLNEILQDKNANLLPRNIKTGVTCLGVEGTFYGAKLFKTEQEMKNDEDMKLNDLALVYSDKEETTLNEYSKFKQFELLDNVVLTGTLEQDDYIRGEFSSGDNTDVSAELMISISSDGGYVDYRYYDRSAGISNDYMCSYSFTDGKYVKSDNNFPDDFENTVSLTFGSHYGGTNTFDERVCEFLKIFSPTYKGLFKCQDTKTDDVVLGLLSAIDKSTEVYSLPNNSDSYDTTGININKLIDACKDIDLTGLNAESKYINLYKDTSNNYHVIFRDRYGNWGDGFDIYEKEINTYYPGYMYHEIYEPYKVIYLYDLVFNEDGTYSLVNKQTKTAIVDSNVPIQWGTSVEQRYIYYLTDLNIASFIGTPIQLTTSTGEFKVMYDINSSCLVYHKVGDKYNRDNIRSNEVYRKEPAYVAADMQFTLSNSNQLLPGVRALGTDDIMGDNSIFDNIQDKTLLQKYIRYPYYNYIDKIKPTLDWRVYTGNRYLNSGKLTSYNTTDLAVNVNIKSIEKQESDLTYSSMRTFDSAHCKYGITYNNSKLYIKKFDNRTEQYIMYTTPAKNNTYEFVCDDDNVYIIRTDGTSNSTSKVLEKITFGDTIQYTKLATFNVTYNYPSLTISTDNTIYIWCDASSTGIQVYEWDGTSIKTKINKTGLGSVYAGGGQDKDYGIYPGSSKCYMVNAKTGQFYTVSGEMEFCSYYYAIGDKLVGSQIKTTSTSPVKNYLWICDFSSHTVYNKYDIPVTGSISKTSIGYILETDDKTYQLDTNVDLIEYLPFKLTKHLYQLSHKDFLTEQYLSDNTFRIGDLYDITISDIIKTKCISMSTLLPEEVQYHTIYGINLLDNNFIDKDLMFWQCENGTTLLLENNVINNQLITPEQIDGYVGIGTEIEFNLPEGYEQLDYLVHAECLIDGKWTKSYYDETTDIDISAGYTEGYINELEDGSHTMNISYDIDYSSYVQDRQYRIVIRFLLDDGNYSTNIISINLTVPNFVKCSVGLNNAPDTTTKDDIVVRHSDDNTPVDFTYRYINKKGVTLAQVIFEASRNVFIDWNEKSMEVTVEENLTNHQYTLHMSTEW